MAPLDVNRRFDEKYIPEPNSGCWLWTAYVCPRGYGSISPSHHTIVSAHRFSYERYVGPIPPGLHVCHKCDVPSCVNPDHLFVGTNAENRADSVRKGRAARGERHGAARLTEADVLAIRRSDKTLREIAAEYGIARFTAWRVVHGRSWRHVIESDLLAEAEEKAP